MPITMAQLIGSCSGFQTYLVSKFLPFHKAIGNLRLFENLSFRIECAKLQGSQDGNNYARSELSGVNVESNGLHIFFVPHADFDFTIGYAYFSQSGSAKSACGTLKSATTTDPGLLPPEEKFVGGTKATVTPPPLHPIEDNDRPMNAAMCVSQFLVVFQKALFQEPRICLCIRMARPFVSYRTWKRFLKTGM
jgi:hypothetical protein